MSNTQHSAIQAYLEAHKDRFLEELKAWLRIPSVSAKPDHHTHVLNAAAWLEDRLRELDLDRVERWETPGNPIVFGEKIIDPALPTVLVYGHYDVQPPEPLDLWTTPAFEPSVRDGNLYARGATDDKGQTYLHVKAAETLLNTGGLPCNLKFFIEGEEEVGSANLAPSIETYADRLRADVVLISDTSMLGNDTPSITVGLRGICYVEVKVTGPNRDLHSGTYGGAVENPINVLCRLIGRLHDENRRITLPGFYDDVVELSAEERAELGRVPFDEATYKAELGLKAIAGEAGYTPREHTGIRPTLDINGIYGGYTGPGAKTVLPSEAHAKLSMRLVPNQDPQRVLQLITDYFTQNAPPTVRVEVTPHHGGKAFVTATDFPGYRAASAAMEATFGKRPIPTREGGSIPVPGLFHDILGIPSVLLGFGLDSDALHSPNEHFGLFNFCKGIETVAVFHHRLRELAATPQPA